MNIISLLLFAISANTDNFVVALSYGIKEIKIGFLSNFFISLISLIGTILSMTLSKVIVNIIPVNISKLIGSLILILIGLWTIVKPLLKDYSSNSILENPEKIDKDSSFSIDPKESITLAFALTINNIGLGIGGSIAGLNILITSFLTFIFSFLMILIGYFIGSKYFSKVLGNRATFISGLLMIGLGLSEAFLC